MAPTMSSAESGGRRASVSASSGRTSVDVLMNEIHSMVCSAPPPASPDMSEDAAYRRPRSSMSSTHRGRPLPRTPSSTASSQAPLATASGVPSTRRFSESAARASAPGRPLPQWPSPHSSLTSAATALPPAYTPEPPPLQTQPPPPSLLGSHVDLSRLSQVAQLLSCVLPRHSLVKGSVVYPLSFTGHDLVVTVTRMLTQYVSTSPLLRVPTEPERKDVLYTLALAQARSLVAQLFVHEADWNDHPLTDDVSGVYMLLSDATRLDGKEAHNVAVPDRDTQLFVRGPWQNVALSATMAAVCASVPVHDVPTGVFTSLTTCYSPTCALSDGMSCYAPSCPRAARGFDKPASEAAATAPAPSRAWVEIVPPSLVEALPSAEVKRQNAIFEFVEKEDMFVRDLRLLASWATHLEHLAQPTAGGSAQDVPLRGAALVDFVRDVFGHVAPLLERIEVFVQQLHERQREEGPVIQTIGDVVVQAALEWATTYTAYVAHYPFALARLKTEAASNARLQRFLDDCRRDPAAGRHPLDSFLFRPPARLQRYHLHLESILKHTDKNHEDREALALALSVIDEQCRLAQAGVEAAELRLHVREYASTLAAKGHDSYVDMDLLSPERVLVHSSTVYRRPDSFELEATPLEAVLFDNYFVLAKRKKLVEADAQTDLPPTKLVFSKRPIPVACLEAGGFQDAALAPSSMSARWWPSQRGDMYPFSVWHRSRPMHPIMLLVPTAEERATWRAKLTQTAHAWQARKPLLRGVDLGGSALAAAERSEGLSGGLPTSQLEVTCVASWEHVPHTTMVAIGTSEGVWIGRYGQPATLRKVLHMRHVMQCAILAPYRRFLVLADRTLLAYDLEALVPSSPAIVSVAPLRIGGTRDVQCFALGELRGRPMVVYAKRKTSESSVRVLTPLTEPGRSGQPEQLLGFHLVHVRAAADPEILCIPRRQLAAVCAPRRGGVHAAANVHVPTRCAGARADAGRAAAHRGVAPAAEALGGQPPARRVPHRRVAVAPVL